MLARVKASGGRPRWIVKRKFTLAFLAWVAGTVMAAKGIHLATEPAQVVTVLASYGSFCFSLFGVTFASDVGDKWLNGGHYHASEDPPTDEEHDHEQVDGFPRRDRRAG